MDVVDAIMKIVADIFSLNNISGDATSAIVGVMGSFFKGIVALVQMIINMYEVLSAL